MPSVAAMVVAGAARLRAAGLTPEDADRDAAVIARGLLGWSLADWLSQRGREADAPFIDAFDPLITRRATFEPVAYLLGTREFYGRPFHVQSGVLIPRPETELLIETALQWISATGARNIADVGTGTGCISVTLALEVPDLHIVATDQSSDALAVAQRNANDLDVQGRIEWRHTDLLNGIEAPLDLVVSNPPYVPERDRTTLSPDVRDHEPALALFAGDDGLDVIRRLIPDAARHLRPGGGLILEVGAGQSATVTSLLSDAGFTNVTWHADLQKITRIVAAQK